MSYSAAVLADNPLSYWRLGESSGTTAVDVQGNSNGTYASGTNGGVTLGAAGLLTGDANTAIFIPALDDNGWVNLGTPNATAALAGWTWEVWLNTGATALTIPGIFGEVTYLPDQARLLQLHQTTTWDLDVRIFNGTSVVTRTVTGLPYDTTMHLAVTVANAQTTNPTVTVYRDGTSVGTWSDYGTTLTAPYRTQGLGVRDGAVDRFYGTFDEAAFYTSALSQARVQAHYDAGVSTQLAPRKVRWSAAWETTNAGRRVRYGGAWQTGD